MAVAPNHWRAHLGLATAELLYAGYHIIAKLALNAGVNKIVFSIYRDLIALSVVAPLAYFREKTLRPPLNTHFLLTFCLLGFMKIFAFQILLILGLAYTNPVYTSAFLPSIPVFTIILAVLAGVETLNVRKLEGRAKLGGTLVCVSGAILLVMFRGPAILSHSKPNLSDTIITRLSRFALDNWNIGTLCMIGNSLCGAIILVIQAQILAKYPATISVMAYTLFFGAIFLLASALVFANDPSDWSLTRSEAFAVCYAGFIGSAVNYGIMTWSVKILGPNLVALYNTILPVSSAILSRIILGSPIYLGSVVGGGLIIAGLYLVTWASYLERKSKNENPHGSPEAEPFLIGDLLSNELPNQAGHASSGPSNSTATTRKIHSHSSQ